MPIFRTNTGSLGALQVSGSTVISGSGTLGSNLFKVIGTGSAILSVSGGTGPLLEISDENAANNKILAFSSASIDIFSIYRNRTVEITGSIALTGSTTINNMLTIVSQSTLPTTGVPSASFMTSGSGTNLKPYFWNGSTWTALF